MNRKGAAEVVRGGGRPPEIERNALHEIPRAGEMKFPLKGDDRAPARS